MSVRPAMILIFRPIESVDGTIEVRACDICCGRSPDDRHFHGDGFFSSG